MLKRLRAWWNEFEAHYTFHADCGHLGVARTCPWCGKQVNC